MGGAHLYQLASRTGWPREQEVSLMVHVHLDALISTTQKADPPPSSPGGSQGGPQPTFCQTAAFNVGIKCSHPLTSARTGKGTAKARAKQKTISKRSGEPHPASASSFRQPEGTLHFSRQIAPPLGITAPFPILLERFSGGGNQEPGDPTIEAAPSQAPIRPLPTSPNALPALFTVSKHSDGSEQKAWPE